MDPEQTALPTGDTAAAGEQSTTDAAAAQTTEQAGDQHEATGEQAEGADQGVEAEGGDKPAKKEKSPEQREIERLRRRVDNLTRQKYEARAQAGQPEQRQQQGTQATDDEPVTLSRAELQRLIAEQAQQLAPAVTEQKAEIERRQGVISSLAKQWGKEEFDAKAADLDDAFGGLVDRSGKPKPATDAIFDADDPRAVIEYLTDPDNADEAERIARLPATRAGREIARIESKLAEAKKTAKPAKSNAARPIEAVKGGSFNTTAPDPAKDPNGWIAWRNKTATKR